jgi:hypothetical protein
MNELVKPGDCVDFKNERTSETPVIVWMLKWTN